MYKEAHYHKLQMAGIKLSFNSLVNKYTSLKMSLLILLWKLIKQNQMALIISWSKPVYCIVFAFIRTDQWKIDAAARFHAINVKYCICIISKDIPFKEGHFRFTTVPFKPLSDRQWGNNLHFSVSFKKMLSSANVLNFL